MLQRPKGSSTPLDPRARTVLRAVFITLFIDLIGFSIIFPLFPHMLEYYLSHEGRVGMLRGIVRLLEGLSAAAGAGPGGTVVLFGGLLGSLYSLLQFACAPLLGSLSDRHGRRPILVLSVAGIALSYVLWFVAGRFALLVVARVIGGIMSANISTATAIVADVTSEENRGKGMAIIGIAFGLGFIVGPAIGGFSAELNPLDRWPELARYGINPFSVPAFIALVLSLVNLTYVLFVLPETRPAGAGRTIAAQRPLNPLKLFHTENYPGVTRTNLAYFIFLSTFSGAEFALSFLAADRLGYAPRQIAVLMLFVGVVLVLVQGSYVQRRASEVGAKRMSIQGFVMAIPGILLVGHAESALVLYLGLFFMAAGSAQIIPCLSALASLYTPAHDQGRILGVFRSLGALARAIGPLLACLLYWRLGSAITYYLVALFMAAPLWIAFGLPAPRGLGGVSEEPGT
jgi:MFS family permease